MFKNNYRIIDANINRASEGLRVLEDFFRFFLKNKNLSENTKKVRHLIRKDISFFNSILIKNRDSKKDIGLNISKNTKLDQKKNNKDLVYANFRRVQEALRSIEENLKVASFYDLSKIYEDHRFSVYNIEKDFFSMSKKEKFLNTNLYAITAEKFSKNRNNIEVVKEMIRAGIKIIQYREKEKKKLYKYEECKIIRQLTLENDVCFIVNDDIDIAVSVNADGLHIGQEDMPIEQARKIVGDDMIIGVSTHNETQAQDAIKRGADYIGVGPIFQTYTKEDVVAPVGFDYLNYAVKNVNIPFVVIGGIKKNNLKEVVKRGGKLVAMVTEIVEAENIFNRVKEIQKIIQDSK